MKTWFFYVVHCSDDTLYSGVTTDIVRRVNEHNKSKRGAKYTRSRRPVRLVYSVYFHNRSQAQKSEHYFKKLTRKEKEEIIKVNGSW
jgi:putative endonuclease